MLKVPVEQKQVPHRMQGYSQEQSYARAFNEANKLKHTLFESKPKHKAKP